MTHVERKDGGWQLDREWCLESARSGRERLLFRVGQGAFRPCGMALRNGEALPNGGVHHPSLLRVRRASLLV